LAATDRPRVFHTKETAMNGCIGFSEAKDRRTV